MKMLVCSCGHSNSNERKRKTDANRDQTGLLRTVGRATQGAAQGDPPGLPQARSQVPSRSEPRRQILRRKIQADPRSLRRPVGFEEAADVRPVRLLRRKLSGRATARRRDAAQGGPVRFWRL